MNWPLVQRVTLPLPCDSSRVDPRDPDLFDTDVIFCSEFQLAFPCKYNKVHLHNFFRLSLLVREKRQR